MRGRPDRGQQLVEVASSPVILMHGVVSGFEQNGAIPENIAKTLPSLRLQHVVEFDLKATARRGVHADVHH